MKKKLITSAILIIAIFTALAISNNIFSKANSDPYPTFQVTVYQTNGTTAQSGAEVVVYDSNNNQLLTGTTDGSGVKSWSWTYGYGTYTVKSWYPARPNDGQNVQKTVIYSGASIYTSVILGPNY